MLRTNTHAKYILLILLFAAVTGLFLYGNVITQKGSVLDNAILNEDDIYRKMDIHVKALKKDGLNAGEFIPIIMEFPGGIRERSDLEKIFAFDKAIKQNLPDLGTMSLVDAVDYHDDGFTLANNKYLNERLLSDPHLDIEQWKHSIRRNEGVYGILVGRNFDYTIFAIYLPQGYDEILTYRRVVQFLEQRKISSLAWYLKTDIQPFFDHVMAAGWVMGRGLIDASVNVDIFNLSGVGLMLTSIFFYLMTGSLRQTLITSLGIVLLSILWVRGSIGILNLAGFPIKERVFSVCSYTNCIVQGLSFALHSFESYNGIYRATTGLTRQDAWGSVARDVYPLLNLTAVISFLGFAGLYWFQVLSIRELGIISALGVVYLLVLCKVFLPAVHILVGGDERNKHLKLFTVLDAAIDRLTSSLLRTIGRIPARKRVQYTLSSLVILIAVAVALFCGNLLEVNSRPLEYLRGTLIEKAATFANTAGHSGFDWFEMVIRPANQGEIHDPEFIVESAQFLTSLRDLPNLREVSSILSTVSLIARESYKRPFPVSQQEVSDILFLIENDLDPRVKEQLWHDRGVRVSVSTAITNSNEQQAFSRAMLEKAQTFKGIEVFLYGKATLYAQFDRYVSLGKPWNLASSQVMIIAICALWIAWKNFRHRAEERYCLYGWRSGVVMSIPFLLSSLLMAIIMMLFKIPLDIATATVSALAINASIDFSLYFIADYQRNLLAGAGQEEAMHHTITHEGRVVIKDTLLNAVCFMPLLLSQFPPVSKLGWIMTVMLVSCCVGTLIFMPALLHLCVRKPRLRGRKTGQLVSTIE